MTKWPWVTVSVRRPFVLLFQPYRASCGGLYAFIYIVLFLFKLPLPSIAYETWDYTHDAPIESSVASNDHRSIFLTVWQFPNKFSELVLAICCWKTLVHVSLIYGMPVWAASLGLGERIVPRSRRADVVELKMNDNLSIVECSQDVG